MLATHRATHCVWVNLLPCFQRFSFVLVSRVLGKPGTTTAVRVGWDGLWFVIRRVGWIRWNGLWVVFRRGG